MTHQCKFKNLLNSQLFPSRFGKKSMFGKQIEIMKKIRLAQEPIAQSIQLPCVRATAFSQVGLFLDL